MSNTTEKRGSIDRPLYKVVDTDTYNVMYTGRNYHEACQVEGMIENHGGRPKFIVDYGETDKTNMEERGIKTDAQEDVVNLPKHYRSGEVECIEAMESMALNAKLSPFVGYLWLNAFKYLWRWPFKNGVEDLKKCRWYIDRLIMQLEKQ